MGTNPGNEGSAARGCAAYSANGSAGVGNDTASAVEGGAEREKGGRQLLRSFCGLGINASSAFCAQRVAGVAPTRITLI